MSIIASFLRKLRGGRSVCRCGHARSAHEHYRRGTDCALCSCLKWKRSR